MPVTIIVDIPALAFLDDMKQFGLFLWIASNNEAKAIATSVTVTGNFTANLSNDHEASTVL
jgi:hypothetical protein